MKISLCNEVIREMSFPDQCALAAKLGYDGLEIAPFTVSDDPRKIPAGKRAEMRRTALDSGIAVTGLHWLLLTPPGLSVTTADRKVRLETIDVMKGLIDLCADLGGTVLIHGSPKQRMISENEARDEAERRALEAFSEVAPHAERAGVIYCIEPLTPAETNFLNNLEEAADLVNRVGNPAFRSMLDAKAANGAEVESLPDLVSKWLPPGIIAHVHVNDRNLRGPGQGEDRFVPLFSALSTHGYDKLVAVEPFDYYPDGPTSAARAIGYIRGILEGLTTT